MTTLADLAVISEPKIGATAGEGLDHRELAQDMYKLSLLGERFTDTSCHRTGTISTISARDRERPGMPPRRARGCPGGYRKSPRSGWTSVCWIIAPPLRREIGTDDCRPHPASRYACKDF